MPSLALRQLLARSAVAAAASVLALGSTASLVAVAAGAPVVTVPAVVQPHASGHPGPGKNGNPSPSPSPGPIGTVVGAVTPSPVGIEHGPDSGKGVGIGPGPIATLPGPAVAPVVSSIRGDTKPVPTESVTPAGPAQQHAAPAAVVHAVAHAVTASAPNAHVVVNAAEPAPFTTAPIAALDVSARVLPTERLGPLSGISFGGGLFIWPLLLVINALALSAIARMALRRRLTSPED